jgi:hypothetical protein
VRPISLTQTPAENAKNVSRHLMQVEVEGIRANIGGYRDFREIQKTTAGGDAAPLTGWLYSVVGSCTEK